MAARAFRSRRQVMGALAGLVVLAAWPASAQVTAVPAYRGEHALQGLYGLQLPPLARSFEARAAALSAAARSHCAAAAGATALQAAWRDARLAWLALSNPALGPVIARRSQREIDFWPVRPALLKKALDSRPRTLEAMRRVGGPAKGFGAMEVLLAGPPAPSHCPYLVLVAEGIEAEARALREGFERLARRDWAAEEDAARSAFAEWVNQWLGGLESLRWQQIEQPLQRARTAGRGQPPVFARQRLEDNREDWQVQWQSLQAQARLRQDQRKDPPQPGQAPVAIEALLLGKGHIGLAERWGQAINAVSAAMTALPARPGERELMALSARMKNVTSLYQREVAAALDVPLGFSSADGD